MEMTIPDKPNSRLQKYRLTDKGRQWLAQQGSHRGKVRQKGTNLAQHQRPACRVRPVGLMVDSGPYAAMTQAFCMPAFLWADVQPYKDAIQCWCPDVMGNEDISVTNAKRRSPITGKPSASRGRGR